MNIAIHGGYKLTFKTKTVEESESRRGYNVTKINIYSTDVNGVVIKEEVRIFSDRPLKIENT